MIKKVKEWFSEYEYEILAGYSIFITALAIFFVVISILFMAISNDLADVVSMKNTELEEVTMEKNRYYYLIDELKQNYEDVIPKQQYIDDVEYLESVIRDLREQLETYNN